MLPPSGKIERHVKGSQKLFLVPSGKKWSSFGQWWKKEYINFLAFPVWRNTLDRIYMRYLPGLLDSKRPINGFGGGPSRFSDVFNKKKKRKTSLTTLHYPEGKNENDFFIVITLSYDCVLYWIPRYSVPFRCVRDETFLACFPPNAARHTGGCISRLLKVPL